MAGREYAAIDGAIVTTGAVAPPSCRTESYGASCVMTIAVPVIVSVAVRCGPVLGATANWTVPSVVPDAPEVIVRNGALLTAVHVQLVPRGLTVIDADPPEAGNVVVVVPVMN